MRVLGRALHFVEMLLRPEAILQSKRIFLERATLITESCSSDCWTVCKSTATYNRISYADLCIGFCANDTQMALQVPTDE